MKSMLSLQGAPAHLMTLRPLARQGFVGNGRQAAVQLHVKSVQQAAHELLCVALLPIAPALIAQPRLLHEPAQRLTSVRRGRL